MKRTKSAWALGLGVAIALPATLLAADTAGRGGDTGSDAGLPDAEYRTRARTPDAGAPEVGGDSREPSADAAETGTTTVAQASDDNPSTGAPESGDGASAPDLPEDSPEVRLKYAEKAYRNGNFQRIPPLLRPVLKPTPDFESADNRVQARELLGVGLYFAAQRANDSGREADLMQRARDQFLELLRERPDHELDSMIYPKSVVEVFKSVKADHSDELAALRAKGGSTNKHVSSSSGTTLYIEREVVQNNYYYNFLPAGVGQFQNDDPVKGWLVVSGQAAAVGLHVVAYFAIESLRNPNGTIPGEAVGSDKYKRAVRWRAAQYAAWGFFGLAYGYSIVDGITNFEPRETNKIRTRDKPPPELSDSGDSTGNGPTVRIGLGSVHVRW